MADKITETDIANVKSAARAMISKLEGLPDRQKLMAISMLAGATIAALAPDATSRNRMVKAVTSSIDEEAALIMKKVGKSI